MSKYPYKLKDLIDIEHTAQMFELLYEVAQIPNAMLDMEGNVLVGAGWQSICTDFHRKKPESAAICVESDTHINEEIAAGKPHCIYECPLGLVDSSCPIIIDGQHLGNVFTGQMLHTPLTDDARDRFRAQAKQYGYNEEAYLKALEQVPVFPIEQHKEILKLLANIAEQLAHSGLEKLKVIEQSKKLEESEERYNLAMAATKDGIYDWNLVTNEIYYSPTWKRMLGYEDDELPNELSVWEKLTKPEDVKASWKMQQEVINKQRDHFQMEFQMLRKDGHWVDILSRAEAVFDDTGKAIRMVGTHIDISERKLAEVALSNSEEKYRLIVENANDGIEISQDDKIIYSNTRFAKMLGYSVDEISGVRFDTIFTKEAKASLQERGRIVKSKELQSDTYETTFHRKDMSIIDVEVKYEITEFKGKPATFAIVRDITKRKLAEEDLRNSEMRYRSLIDATASIIWTTDATGGYVSPQPSWEKFTGQPWSEAKGYGWGKKIHPDDTERILAAWEKAVEELSIYETWGHVWNEELKEWCDFEVTAVPILALDGSLHEWVGIMTDITKRKQAEEALRTSEKLTRSITETAADAIISIDSEGIILSWNKAAQQIFGYTSSEMINSNLNRILPEQHKNNHQNGLKRLKSGGKAKLLGKTVEIQGLRKDGTEFPIELSLTSWASEKQKHYTGIIRDITDRKQTENELALSEEKYRTFVEQASEGIYLFEVKNPISVNQPADDQIKDLYKGHIVEANDSQAKMYGYDRADEILGKTLAELHGSTDDPENLKFLRSWIEADYRIVDMESHEADEDGNELWFSNNVIGHVEDGYLVHIWGTQTDITERKLAEVALLENEEKYRTLVESLQEGIGKVDENESFTFVNQAAADIFGFSIEEMIGKNLKEFISARAFDQIQEQTAKRKAGDSSKYELEVIREIGANRIIEVYATPIESEQQEYQGAFAIFPDITDRKRSEVEIKEALQKATAANEVKDQFVANISHEVRTPLNSILGFSDLLKQRYSDIISEKDRSIFGYINAASDRLMHTVDSILNLSLMTAGTINIQKQELDLGSITTQVVEQLKLSAQDKHLDLNFTPPKKPQVIFADEYCIHQSILNLTDNAIKYTKEGTVELKFGTRDDRVTLSVIDTGIGISDEYQKRLFDAYTQESEGFTKNNQGVGLGLTLTKQYLELNDVELEFESKKNIGTTFTLIFPKYEEKS